MIYPISKTKKPSNLHLSPNCWHGISNINIYIQLNYTPQIVGSLYPIQLDILQKCTLPNSVHEAHTETLQLTFILQLLAWYIKYQLTYSTVTYPPNCWHRIFNTNLHLYKCTLPQKPSILDSSHICCHDTADLNVQCTSYNVQCTTDIYSPYCDAFVHFTFLNNLKLECIRYIDS